MLMKIFTFSPDHFGIIICTEDRNYHALAHRIHEAIEARSGNLEKYLVRINRPNLGQPAFRCSKKLGQSVFDVVGGNLLKFML